MDNSPHAAASRALALGGSTLHYARPPGAHLLQRTAEFGRWVEARLEHGLLPYSRALQERAGPEARIAYDNAVQGGGLNFASQDYLSMNSRPEILAAAREAMEAFGVHSAGSPALLGNTRLSIELEKELADFLRTDQVVLFPTGWGAGFSAVSALVRPSDHIVLDELSHACLHAGVNSATRNVVLCPHLDVQAMIASVRAIRARDAKNGVLVVTESLFSMDSDTPDLAALQSACRELEAVLLVDVAHDLGAMGPGGCGHIGAQKLLGQVDLVMGSFSKTFASNGGFIATQSRAVRHYIKYFGGPHTFSNALSPVQAAIVRKALALVRAPLGDALRERLRENVAALRSAFAEAGIACLGDASPIVPVPVGSEAVARLASKLMFERGVLANLVEFPAVKSRHARFRMQVMADHTPASARRAARVVAACIEEAKREWESLGQEAA